MCIPYTFMLALKIFDEPEKDDDAGLGEAAVQQQGTEVTQYANQVPALLSASGLPHADR
jgi:hypothetical protein